MKRKTLLVLAVLLVGYIGLFGFSANGYGYAGHNGYDHGPSFWYIGGPHFYSSRSIRSQSPGGPGSRGTGIHYGK